MKEKIYSMHGTAIDNNGQEHEVTIAGVYTQVTTYETKHKLVQVPIDDDKSVDGYLSFNRKQIKRNLKYSFSICHPEDDFNEEFGIQKAIKRAKTSPMGELETKYITTLCPDQINIILYGELQHIINNIDKYIEKN